jgi:hypothetical protein
MFYLINTKYCGKQLHAPEEPCRGRRIGPEFSRQTHLLHYAEKLSYVGSADLAD